MPRPMVEMFLFSPKLSGKSSMHETAIIVPAEKHKKNERIEATMSVQKKPITANNGSTAPETKAHKKLLHFDSPAFKSGKLTLEPSGKFWIPMPTASIMLPIMAVLEPARLAPAKAMPMQSPSGMLWSEIAIVLITGSLSFPLTKCDKNLFFNKNLSIKNSIKTMKKTPKNTPKVQINAGFLFNFSQFSIPTNKSENMLEAIIMPAEKLKIRLITFWLICLKNKTTAPPSVVIRQAKDEKITVSQKGEMFVIFHNIDLWLFLWKVLNF